MPSRVPTAQRLAAGRRCRRRRPAGRAVYRTRARGGTVRRRQRCRAVALARRQQPLPVGTRGARSGDAAAVRHGRSRRRRQPCHGNPAQGAARDGAPAGGGGAAPGKAGNRAGDRDRRYRRHLAAGAGHRGIVRLRRTRAAGGGRASHARRPRRRRIAAAAPRRADARLRVHGARHGPAGRPRAEFFQRYRPGPSARSGCRCVSRHRTGCVLYADLTRTCRADGDPRRRRLRVPHRSAAAPGSGGDAALDRDPRRDFLLREHGPELGTRRHAEGASGGR